MPSPLSSANAVVLGPGTLGRLEAHLSPWSARLELDLPESAGDSLRGSDLLVRCDADPREPHRQRWRLEMRISSTSGVDIPGAGADQYLLVPCLVSQGGGVTETILSLLGALADVQVACAGRLHHGSLLAAARLLVDTFGRLPPVCSGPALTASRGFPGSGMSQFVLRTVASDPSGRVLQMLDVCPGLVILAKGLQDLNRDYRSAEVLDAVRRGWKLGRVLDLAEEAWCWTLWSLGAHAPDDRYSVSDEERRVQRLRIRRASRMVSPGVLVSPALPGVCAEDIPAEPLLNARWFEVTCFRLLNPALLESRDDGRETWWGRPAVHNRDIAVAGLSARQLRRFGGLLSRHWRTMGALARDRGRPFHVILGELVDFLRVTGRHPGRGTDPQKLLEDCERWHLQGNWIGDLEDRPGRWRPERLVGLQDPLDTKGLEDWVSPEGKISPLRTVAELYRESDIMQHCVAAYAHSDATADAQFFHADIRGAYLTVMTQRDAVGRLRILQTAGVSNRPTTREEEDVLDAWLDDMQPGAANGEQD